MQAVQAIRRMRGGSQSQLMVDADAKLWIVKFQNNPQGTRILANEWIATRLAEAIGLPVPRTEIISVPEQITSDLEMYMEYPRGERRQYLPGEHFGSAFVGGLMPKLVVDYMPSEQLGQVRNLVHFAGILLLDKWTGNCDGRQAVFQRNSRQSKYNAIFIDQGLCFNAGEWNFLDAPLRGIYGRNSVYAGVKGWSSFEPWLSRIENIDFATMWRIAEAVPQVWYGGHSMELRSLMERLFGRRDRVRDLITAFRDSDREPFPLWMANLRKGMRD